MKTITVESYFVACLDEGSIPSDSTLLARKLNVYGLFYFRLPERLPKVLINYLLKTTPIYNNFFIRILVS